MDWRPCAPVEMLRRRARLLRRVRHFFDRRGVVEVETPLLDRHGSSDPQLDSLAVAADDLGWRWLQTSPEFAMKRLLAAGIGPCYQITRAFRGGESGRLHNPEFAVLEWYRPGFDQHALMREIAALCGEIAGVRPVEKVSYRELFLDRLGVDPLILGGGRLRATAREYLGEDAWIARADDDALLDALMGLVLGPEIGHGRFTFLTDFPASQAALARLDPADPRVAQRFELFIDGLEIANGFRELTDAAEQRRRFGVDNRRRLAAGLPVMAPDERLLAAMEAGLPDMSGVAVGLDRLFLVALGGASLSEVMAFPGSCA